MGVRRVYDLEIAEDHCYLANDIYVHNSNPNLQNIPSNSTHAKLIKSCVQAPEGWLFVGLDFASLEDRISALTTKDKNKLKVYLEGYDGHCLRTASYSAEQMPEVTAARDEIAKPGQTYKVTYSDGSVEFFNENNPLLKELRNASSTN